MVDCLGRPVSDIGRAARVNYVQIFENSGATMGCSNPHPHGQIWASESLPNDAAKSKRSQRDYHGATQSSCLLCDYLRRGDGSGERIVCENDAFVALVPFWATWPFETWCSRKSHVGDLDGIFVPPDTALWPTC